MWAFKITKLAVLPGGYHTHTVINLTLAISAQVPMLGVAKHNS